MKAYLITYWLLTQRLHNYLKNFCPTLPQQAGPSHAQRGVFIPRCRMLESSPEWMQGLLPT